MTEKLEIKGKEVWVVVTPHVREEGNNTTIPTEYFTAAYNLGNPDEMNDIMFTDNNDPKLFVSPVAALEYANEYLISIL